MISKNTNVICSCCAVQNPGHLYLDAKLHWQQPLLAPNRPPLAAAACFGMKFTSVSDTTMATTTCWTLPAARPCRLVAPPRVREKLGVPCTAAVTHDLPWWGFARSSVFDDATCDAWVLAMDRCFESSSSTLGCCTVYQLRPSVCGTRSIVGVPGVSANFHNNLSGYHAVCTTSAASSTNGGSGDSSSGLGSSNSGSSVGPSECVHNRIVPDVYKYADCLERC